MGGCADYFSKMQEGLKNLRLSNGCYLGLETSKPYGSTEIYWRLSVHAPYLSVLRDWQYLTVSVPGYSSAFNFGRQETETIWINLPQGPIDLTKCQVEVAGEKTAVEVTSSSSISEESSQVEATDVSPHVNYVEYKVHGGKTLFKYKLYTWNLTQTNGNHYFLTIVVESLARKARFRFYQVTEEWVKQHKDAGKLNNKFISQYAAFTIPANIRMWESDSPLEVCRMVTEDTGLPLGTNSYQRRFAYIKEKRPRKKKSEPNAQQAISEGQ